MSMLVYIDPKDNLFWQIFHYFIIINTARRHVLVHRLFWIAKNYHICTVDIMTGPYYHPNHKEIQLDFCVPFHM